MNGVLQALLTAVPALLAGVEVTVAAAALGIVLAMCLAIPAGLGRISRSGIIRSVSTFYVEVVRGTPLLLQLYIWFYGVNILLGILFHFNIDQTIYNMLTVFNSNTIFPKQGISSFFFGVIGLSVNYGAYLAEVIRAGVLAVDKGQGEAAATLGMSRWQTMRLIVLPQALRIMVPPLTNNFITLVQDTAFLQVLGVADLSLVALTGAQVTSSASIRWGFFGAELVIYFIICYSIALIARRFETNNSLGIAPRRSIMGGALSLARRPRAG
ncbi:MAG: amino acid ABC transporter permease [Ktedonobacterales bacterium]